MFWRMLWRLLRAGRGRLAVALVALASGAAVCSALLNLQWDAERKLTREFRSLGANVVASARTAGAGANESALLEASILEKVSSAAATTGRVVAEAPYLYVVAQAVAAGNEQSVILAGTWLDQARGLYPWWEIEGQWMESREDVARCLVGRNVARLLGLAPGNLLEVRVGGRVARLTVAGVARAGGGEDNQVIVNLRVAQHLAGLPDRVALVQLSVSGTPAEIESVVGRLAAAAPELQVRPIRQFAEAEGQLLARIRLLILLTVVLILVLTALSVLATMTALAMERRRDVGLMKSLGGSMARIVRLFLTEAGTLGAVGGLVGYAAGALLTGWIGQRVFGAAISPRIEVLPLTIALMTGVALAGAFPLRLLGRVRPAAILRGE